MSAPPRPAPPRPAPPRPAPHGCPLTSDSVSPPTLTVSPSSTGYVSAPPRPAPPRPAPPRPTPHGCPLTSDSVSPPTLTVSPSSTGYVYVCSASSGVNRWKLSDGHDQLTSFTADLRPTYRSGVSGHPSPPPCDPHTGQVPADPNVASGCYTGGACSYECRKDKKDDILAARGVGEGREGTGVWVDGWVVWV